MDTSQCNRHGAKRACQGRKDGGEKGRKKNGRSEFAEGKKRGRKKLTSRGKE